eukprot:4937451-Pleurochrysis_carterae.AAC.1
MAHGGKIIAYKLCDNSSGKHIPHAKNKHKGEARLATNPARNWVLVVRGSVVAVKPHLLQVSLDELELLHWKTLVERVVKQKLERVEEDEMQAVNARLVHASSDARKHVQLLVVVLVPELLLHAHLVVLLALGLLILVTELIERGHVGAPLLLGRLVPAASALEALESAAAGDGRRVVRVAAHLVESLHGAANLLDVAEHLFVRLDGMRAIRVLLAGTCAARAPHRMRV